MEKLGITIEQLRKKFIAYQAQYYNEEDMYSQIAQSDQTKSIESGGYDAYLLDEKNGELLNKVLKF